MSNDYIVRAIDDHRLEPEEDEPMEYCYCCDAPLYIGDYSWEIGGKLYCDECAKEIFRMRINNE